VDDATAIDAWFTVMSFAGLLSTCDATASEEVDGDVMKTRSIVSANHSEDPSSHRATVRHR
jgi:hypothetical protein